MTTIQNNTSVATTTATTGGNQLASSVAQGQSTQFMQLLVTQLQNQDPLNPMDNSQMTSQLAQINTVSGINQLNTTLQSAVNSFMASQSLQAASLVGHQVMVPGNTLSLQNGSANGGVDLAQPADDVVVTITDPMGNVVKTQDLGAQESGLVPFTWDGTTNSGAQAAAGNYTMKVAAVQGGAPIQTTAYAQGAVNSVSLDSGNMTLNVAGLGAFSASQVKTIL